MAKMLQPNKRQKRHPLQKLPTDKAKPLAKIVQGIEALQYLDAISYLANADLEELVFDRKLNGERRTAYAREWQCNKTMLELFIAGFIDRAYLTMPSGMANEYPLVSFLTERGAAALQHHNPDANLHWHKDRNPDPRVFCVPDTWEHDAWALHLLSRLVAGARKHGFQPWAIMDDHYLHQLAGNGVPFGAIPDGFFLIHHQGRDYPCFLEVDFSNSHAVWQKKVVDYTTFIKDHYRAVFGDLPDPVIHVIAPGTVRLRNLRKTTEDAGGGGRWWFATIDDVLENAMGAMWTVAGSADVRSIATRVERH